MRRTPASGHHQREDGGPPTSGSHAVRLPDVGDRVERVRSADRARLFLAPFHRRCIELLRVKRLASNEDVTQPRESARGELFTGMPTALVNHHLVGPPLLQVYRNRQTTHEARKSVRRIEPPNALGLPVGIDRQLDVIRNLAEAPRVKQHDAATINGVQAQDRTVQPRGAPDEDHNGNRDQPNSTRHPPRLPRPGRRVHRCVTADRLGPPHRDAGDCPKDCVIGVI
jgi:hypothetical protein